jgi:ADP-ribosyl-[dinitrogen reductase] hydrolase
MTGEWTDDASMALALVDSIAAVGWDLDDQADRYVAWWRTGRHSVNGLCYDIGIATRQALAKFEQQRNAQTSDVRSESASGNGSTKRLAPVPTRFVHLYPRDVSELSRLASESSMTPHASDQCRSACRYLVLVLAWRRMRRGSLSGVGAIATVA